MNPKQIFIAVISTAGLGTLMVVLAMAASWWINEEVSSQLAKAGYVPRADVTALDTRIKGLEVVHEKDVDRVEKKAEAIATILMSD